MTRSAAGRIARAFLLAAAVLVSAWVDWSVLRNNGADTLEYQDIHYAWSSGARLAQTGSLYPRADAFEPNVPTYLPGFYLLAAAGYGLGLKTFAGWLAFWQPVCLVFHLLIGGLIFLVLSRRWHWLAGLIGAGFWQFNAWSIFALSIAHLDTVALFFLLLSLTFLARAPKAAWLSLGVSLCVKQIGALTVPFFLVWEFQRARPSERIRRAAAALGWICLLPALISAPFLLKDASGFVRWTLLFSLGREAASQLGVQPALAFLGWRGFAARAPMLLLIAGAWCLSAVRPLPRYVAAFLVLAIFADLNIVQFPQYMAWPAALLPLAIFDVSRAGLGAGHSTEAK